MPIFVTKLVSFMACACAIVAGSWCLTDYSNRPGLKGNIAADFKLEWVDAEWSLEQDFDDKKRSLIFFYHPHCPCTRATVRCLERLFTRFVDQPNFVAVAYCPGTKDDSWIESSLTAILRNVGQSQIVIDRDGRYCECFGVHTSGHAVVYDDAGKLIFSGGVTPGRGHEGHSQAASDLVDKINGLPGEVSHWPVYGCLIIEPERSP